MMRGGHRHCIAEATAEVATEKAPFALAPLFKQIVLEPQGCDLLLGFSIIRKLYTDAL